MGIGWPEAAHYWHDPRAAVGLCRHAWESLTVRPDREPDDPFEIALQVVLLLALCQLHEEFSEKSVATRSPETSYPLDDETVSEIVNDVTPDKGAAYEWPGERG